MRTPINIDHIVQSSNDHNSNGKNSTYVKHFITSDKNSLKIVPPGVLPSDNELDNADDDDESYSLSEIKAITITQNPIGIDNNNKQISSNKIAKNKKNFTVSLKNHISSQKGKVVKT